MWNFLCLNIINFFLSEIRIFFSNVSSLYSSKVTVANYTCIIHSFLPHFFYYLSQLRLQTIFFQHQGNNVVCRTAAQNIYKTFGLRWSYTKQHAGGYPQQNNPPFVYSDNHREGPQFRMISAVVKRNKKHYPLYIS